METLDSMPEDVGCAKLTAHPETSDSHDSHVRLHLWRQCKPDGRQPVPCLVTSLTQISLSRPSTSEMGGLLMPV